MYKKPKLPSPSWVPRYHHPLIYLQRGQSFMVFISLKILYLFVSEKVKCQSFSDFICKITSCVTDRSKQVNIFWSWPHCQYHAFPNVILPFLQTKKNKHLFFFFLEGKRVRSDFYFLIENSCPFSKFQVHTDCHVSLLLLNWKHGELGLYAPQHAWHLSEKFESLISTDQYIKLSCQMTGGQLQHR